jgi:hypothetical protein
MVMVLDLSVEVQRLVFASFTGWSVVSSEYTLEADLRSGRQK